jgi:hypothetical protein
LPGGAARSWLREEEGEGRKRREKKEREGKRKEEKEKEKKKEEKKEKEEKKGKRKRKGKKIGKRGEEIGKKSREFGRLLGKLREGFAGVFHFPGVGVIFGTAVTARRTGRRDRGVRGIPGRWPTAALGRCAGARPRCGAGGNRGTRVGEGERETARV